MSSLVLLVSLVGLGVYGYSIYFMATDTNLKNMRNLIPPELHKYGQFKFLTYQCLLLQFINAILHVGAYFVKFLEKPRDLFFAGFAYPVGSVVVYSFWAVWHIMGREFIFPLAISQYYPDWLNHVTHTIIVPLNILLALIVGHKYSKNGAALTMVYLASYSGFLLHVKSHTGVFVYRYLETMSQSELALYFGSTGVFAYLMYKSGQLLASLTHSKASQRPALKERKKQR